MLARSRSRAASRGAVLPASLASLIVLLAACGKDEVKATALPSARVSRGDIVVSVQATGQVEPIDTVQVKSKASGVIVKLPVEVGSEVKTGQVIVEIDPHDVQAQFNQAQADDVAATASLRNAIV